MTRTYRCRYLCMHLKMKQKSFPNNLCKVIALCFRQAAMGMERVLFCCSRCKTIVIGTMRCSKSHLSFILLWIFVNYLQRGYDVMF